VDANQGEIVSALLGAGCCVQSLASVGRGCPDLLVYSPLRGLLLIEIKDGQKPPSKDVSEAQKTWHKNWKGHVSIVRCFKDAMGAIGLT